MLTDDVSWVERYAAELASAATRRPAVRWVHTSSGASLAHVGGADGIVAKVHHPRASVGDLSRRLALVVDADGADVFVQPVRSRVVRTPVEGRAVTVWPAVTVLSPDEPEPPWAEAGRLLARFHRLAVPAGAPAPGGPARLARAVERLRTQARTRPHTEDLLALATRLERELREAGDRGGRHTARRAGRQGDALVHGDFHLGQLAALPGGLRLLDADDVGTGGPAWDLARPAGFWAAGLLEDAAWLAFLEGYRAAGGPAVPSSGDPWGSLDLPARCAVFVATVRLRVQGAEGGLDAARVEELAALSAACHRM